MSSSSSETSLTRATLTAFITFPLSLLLLQLPGGLMELIGNALELRYEESIALAASLFFPYGIATACCTALTYGFIEDKETGSSPSLAAACKKLKGKWGRLVPVTCIAGILCLLGMVALIIPALYFMAIFFFFPQLIVSEPHLPWTVYLSRSKKIAKRALLATVTAVVICFLLELGVEKAGDWIGEFTLAFVPSVFFRNGTLLFVHTILYIVLSAMINIWASYFFLKLRAYP